MLYSRNKKEASPQSIRTGGKLGRKLLTATNGRSEPAIMAPPTVGELPSFRYTNPRFITWYTPKYLDDKHRRIKKKERTPKKEKKKKSFGNL